MSSSVQGPQSAVHGPLSTVSSPLVMSAEDLPGEVEPFASLMDGFGIASRGGGRNPVGSGPAVGDVGLAAGGLASNRRAGSQNSDSDVSCGGRSCFQNGVAAGFSNGGQDGQPARKVALVPQSDELSVSFVRRRKAVDGGRSGVRTAVAEDRVSAILAMAANVLPVVAGLASATIQVVVGGIRDGGLKDPAARPETIPSGVGEGGSENGKTAAALTPAAKRSLEILGEADAGWAAPGGTAQTDSPVGPGVGRKSVSTAEKKTLPPGNMVELRETQKQPATIIIKIGSVPDMPDSSPQTPDEDGVQDAGPGSWTEPQMQDSKLQVPRSQIQTDSGMAVAKQDTTVKMAAKKTNYSAVEQKLPGSAIPQGGTAGEKLPAPQLRVMAPASAEDRSESVLAASAAISAGDSTARPFLPELLDSPRIASTGLPYVQRTQDLISLQAVHLRETGADEIRVVIKPDNGLQLILHLVQRDGGVEVRAVLDRGNFGLLNRHWPELQQQLESRGVRVAPLANADPFIGGGSEGFRQPTTPHGQHAGDDAESGRNAGGVVSRSAPGHCHSFRLQNFHGTSRNLGLNLCHPPYHPSTTLPIRKMSPRLCPRQRLKRCPSRIFSICSLRR